MMSITSQSLAAKPHTKRMPPPPPPLSPKKTSNKLLHDLTTFYNRGTNTPVPSSQTAHPVCSKSLNHHFPPPITNHYPTISATPSVLPSHSIPVPSINDRSPIPRKHAPCPIVFGSSHVHPPQHSH